jgi:phage shock protein C
MKSTYSSGHLHNHLDPESHIPEEEFGSTRFEYDNDTNEDDKKSRIARGAGFIILLLVLLFVFQRYFMPIGPDLTTIVKIVPLTGAILVLVIGLGLLRRARSVRKGSMASEWELKDEGLDFDINASAINADAGCGKSSDSVYQGREAEKTGHVKGKARKEKQKAASDANSKEHQERDPHEEAYGFETHKKWYRSREEKMLFGVCGGIAERLDVDPTIVRALFALAFLSYGFSFVIYVVLAVILPKKPQHSLL